MSPKFWSRRQALKAASCGFGYLALAGLAADQAARETRASEAAAVGPLAPKSPHHSPRAKRVIFIFIQGAPSHVDTFDYKPQLQADDGKPDPAGGDRKLLGSPWKFSQHGESGLWISELFPHVAKHADKLCLWHGLTTDIPNHPQAVLQMHTGSFRFARPSLGAWVLYGLGTENQELPGFLAINPLVRVGGPQNYGSAFLPSDYQATRIGSEGKNIADARVPNITNPKLTTDLQRKQLDLLGDLQDAHSGEAGDAELESVIASYELAFRMQATAPKLLDLAGETQETLDRYGIGKPETDDMGRQCLLARRAVEQGVRFVEVTSTGWDHHQNLRTQMTAKTKSVDQPTAALLADLESRGLLEDTLVVYGGEFGRTPTAQNPDGRDHNATAFTMWLAGGGVKGGFEYGKSDEYGIKAVENGRHIHDFNATLLHALGLDHEQLTFRYAGRPFRLTDVYGKVSEEIFKQA